MTRRDAPGPPPWYLSATPLAALPWLIRLRVTTVALDTLVLAVALAVPDADFPLGHIAWLIALSAVVNTVVAVSLWRQQSMARSVVAASLAADVLLLTWLLDLTGGPFNPFAVVYAVHVALAAVSLGRRPAVAIAAGAAISYGVLLYWHTIEGVSGHHRINDFPTHLFTMWTAMNAIAELVAYFVVQASNALDAMRSRATRSERLVSLTTLAAGAAHELSTPLATIALASRELERAAAREASSAALVDDARLIRTEVDRCQRILDQMSGRAGGGAVDDPELLDVGAAIAEAAHSLPGHRAARVAIDAASTLPRIHASRAGFRQALVSLLSNALDASPDGEPVAVTAHATPAPPTLRITVTDRGPGMPPEVRARAGEPFFTTKDPGRGLGLGLFLTRVFAERSGGTLSIRDGDGTTMVLDLPLASPDRAAPS